MPLGKHPTHTAQVPVQVQLHLHLHPARPRSAGRATTPNSATLPSTPASAQAAGAIHRSALHSATMARDPACIPAALLITIGQTAHSEKILSTLNTNLSYSKMMEAFPDLVCNRDLDLPAADPEDFYKKVKLAAKFVSRAETPANIVG